MQNAVMVVAHPDDEILWFSSILNQCKGVIVCFGPSVNSRETWDEGRAALIKEYPLAKVRFLNLRQSDAFEAANWNKPKESASGLRVRRGANSRYAKNAEELLRLLEVELQNESVVFTHNPWGEYGHEEHVQVFRILARLQQTIDFDLYVNGYVGNRSIKLMPKCLHLLQSDPFVRKTDTALASQLKDAYVENDCWTWSADYEWPEHEIFYRAGQADEPKSRTTASMPLSYITRSLSRRPINKKVRKALPTSVKSYLKRALRIR
ncbi:PIG-L family deacetylase [Mycolicibacterium sp. Dal123E01]|uniref:PIG-L family deacetylase n=1 Tax=Mycolicibacterium sp. Dal123E01 TaxID=3457578 RepID=UPI00403E5DED